MSRRHVALVLLAMVPAGCAASLGPGAPVSVATADGKQRYEGARARWGADEVRLSASSGTDCSGQLRPTRETETKAPADFGAILCEDGTSGILLFSGGADASGGAVSGVMARRSVSGRWGAGPGAGAGAGAGT